MQQQFNSNGVPIVVLAQQEQIDTGLKYRNMKPGLAKALIGLGATQLLIGVACIIFQSISIAVWASNPGILSLSYVAHGIWNGIMFSITGVFGILGGTRKTRCKVVSFNVLSVISSAFAVHLIGWAVPSAILPTTYYYGSNRYYYYYLTTTSYTSTADCYTKINVILAMESMMAILGLIEGIIAIISSAVSCAIGACCCSCGGSCCCPPSPPRVQYVLPAENFHLQQILNGNQQMPGLTHPFAVAPNQLVMAAPAHTPLMPASAYTPLMPAPAYTPLMPGVQNPVSDSHHKPYEGNMPTNPNADYSGISDYEEPNRQDYI